MSFFKYLFLSYVLIVVSFSFSYGQLQVNENTAISQIRKIMKRQGILITDVSINCPTGSYATFSGNSNIGLDDGLLLTSGDAIKAVGPNDEPFSTGSNTGHPGSALIESIPGINLSIDACEIIVEFNSACIDEISFNYVFASEEYFETITTVSDAFGIFVNGPGFAADENIALLPSGEEITIANVNDITNSIYFINNGDGNTAPQNMDNTIVQYDGFTTVLTAQANLVNNSDYTISFVIADASDGGLDSGVFIEDAKEVDRFSFESFNNATFNNSIIENCSAGTINIVLNELISQNTDLQLQITGTAQNGIDYVDAQSNNAIPNVINIAAYATNYEIEVLAIQDNIQEGIEDIRFEILDTCGNIIDSLILEILETPELTSNTNDTIVCNNIPVQLSVSGSDTYTWQPSAGLSCADCPNPLANPVETTTYYISSDIGGNCLATDSIIVRVFSNAADAGPNKVICSTTESVEIGPETSTGSLVYEWYDSNGNLIVSDQAILEIDYIDIQNYGNGSSATFVLNTSTISGCSSSDEVQVFYDGNPQIEIVAERDTIFRGENVQLNVSGAGQQGSYVWLNDDIVNNVNGQITFAIPDQTTTISVVGTNEAGCSATATKIIYVEDRPDIIVPSAFSPNGDGVNDELTLTSISVENLEIFRIFNRYGEVVYITTDINSSPWDGEFENSEQPVGVFTYYLVATGIGLEQKIIKKGNITLIR